MPEPAVQVPADVAQLDRAREARRVDDHGVVLAVFAEGIGAGVADLAQKRGVELASEQ
jgi:hypothetical protein